MGPWAYNLMYRRGAPWEIGARDELVALVHSGRLSPEELPRAVDLGCGTGANAVFLAQHGFDVVGVDFSRVALGKARTAAQEAGVAGRCRFIEADLTSSPITGLEPPYDLLVDYGTLDDLRGDDRVAMATSVGALVRDGSRFVLWCFHARRDELDWIRFDGPSRLTPGLEPGEEEELFGDRFEISRLPEPRPETHTACFLLTARPAPS